MLKYLKRIKNHHVLFGSFKNIPILVYVNIFQLLKQLPMKLYPFSISQLHYVETGQFIVRYLTDFTNSAIVSTTDAEFNTLHQAIITQSPVYNNALVQIKAKAESAMLLDRDDRRDKKIATIRRVVSVYEYSDIEAEQIAYKKLKIVLNSFAGLEQQNYEAESLGIANLVKELQSPTNAPYVQLFGLQKHIDNLVAANNDFTTLFDKRSTDTISTVVYDTKALRKQLIESYKNLADYVLVMAKTKKNTDYYTNILAVLNNGRQYFADLLAKREGNAAASNTPPATPAG